MRSAVILAALAVGTFAKVIEKEVYVTDWTTVIVTTTVTQWPTNAASTANTAVVVNQDHTKPAEAAHPTVDVSKKAAKVDSAPAAASTTAAAEVEEAAPSSTTSSSTTSSTTQAELKAVTTSATSSATTAAAASATAAPGAGSSYQESVLYYHNIHRSDHSVPALTWSTDLEEAANTVASSCSYGHDTSVESASGAYGQNIAYGYDKADVGKKIISDMMYTNEAPEFAGLYGQSSPDMTNFAAWGHFSQIVWKSTTQVGCATVSCDDLENVGGAAPYTVCNYGSPGNVAGAYAENVLKPKSA
ncbi:Allergen V5/Tpx-1-related protein [Penicillium robsamsonii]|uniref:Allergen V5/Tpx-1-related protein n=1 Tax=Penicillium robsamsonii TaxID=1792511 RepID=UPI002547EA67|nr:Allergen V5/Tpx-1-related protein [Penicillium robsamsonii]KAJ5816039.1 Allergen V5/Tpx-1-related protein [Penicillium robsamsonii]